MPFQKYPPPHNSFNTINTTILWSTYILPFTRQLLKVAEHSFQEPIPNSPLLLSHLSFGARFLQESRLTTEEFILAFWLRWGLVKNKA